MSTKSVMNHLETLVGFGPRPIGSPANQAAANYLRDVFRAAGLDVDEQPFPCTAWEHTAIRLEQGEKQMEAEANVFSLPCDVTAPIISAGSLTDLETASVQGKILLVYGDLTRTPLSPKSWFLKDERDEHIIQILEALQPAAILAPVTATEFYGQWTVDWQLDIPAATIGRDDALCLLHHPETPVHLRIDARRVPAEARNIVARMPGTKARRLVLCAHFDTVINTPGAYDNGTGAAALLSLAEALTLKPFPFALEFVAFNGHEYLPLGDDIYLPRARDYFQDILACINMDGIGPALASNSITSMACTPEFETQIKTVASRYLGVVWVDPWPESNHSTFAMRGIPSIALGSVGMRGLAHSRQDTLDQISPAKMEEVLSLVAEIVACLR